MTGNAPRIVVIGAGAAGVAAAWRAAAAGATVSVVHGASGATALYAGTADLISWERAASNEPLPDGVVPLATALGIWRIEAGCAQIPTRSGIIRPARARDRALLDLAPLAGRTIAVADVDRDDWDGPLLAAALTSSEWARATGTRFVPVRVSGIRAGHERRIAAVDFARLFDDAERVAWFAEQLRVAAQAGASGWLAGPWLGIERDAAGELGARLGIPVGETTSLPGGVAGARFEAARDRLLAEHASSVVRDRVRRLTPRADSVGVTTSTDTISAGAAILALGGIVGGGVRAVSAELVPGAVGFELSLDVSGARISFAPDFDAAFGCDVAADFELLGRIGLRMDGARVRGIPRVFAAGDVCSGSAHTVLGALSAGIHAADAALGEIAR